VFRKLLVIVFFVVLLWLVAFSTTVMAQDGDGQERSGSRPDARADHAMAYDMESDRIILFGGAFGPNQLTSDTWAFDPTTYTWMQMNPAESPPPGGYTMAYDSQSDRMILFVGKYFYGNNSPPYEPAGETWSYDFNTDTWTNMEPQETPFNLDVPRMVYDTESDRVVLFGGMDVESQLEWWVPGGGRSFPLTWDNDTWSYDLETNIWTRLEPQGDQPPGQWFHTMVYDSDSDRVFAFEGFGQQSGEVRGLMGSLGDVIWAYDLNANTWEKLSPATTPPARAQSAMAYDPVSEQTILFGGYYLRWNYLGSGEAEIGEENRFDDTWAFDYDSNAWTELEQAESPIARNGHAMVYCTSSGNIVLFGGWDGLNEQMTNDTWIFDPSMSTWTEITPGG
jgi:N-acetylneuraminic acid mutarotase